MDENVNPIAVPILFFLADIRLICHINVRFREILVQKHGEERFVSIVASNAFSRNIVVLPKQHGHNFKEDD